MGSTSYKGFWLFDKDYYVDEFEIKAPCKEGYDTQEDYRSDCKEFVKQLKEKKILPFLA
jgi:hypothetical protein